MGKVDLNKRLSWGSPSPRTTSRFFSNADVKKFGRVFYDDFFFDGKRVALHDCIGVALDKNDRTVRVLRQPLAAHALSLTLPARRVTRPRACWSCGRTPRGTRRATSASAGAVRAHSMDIVAWLRACQHALS
jgi:hypothetical protein